MYHYTYLIQYEDGKLYHGVRSCKCYIEEDSYFGSSKHTPNGTVVFKHVLTEHKSREEALEEEVWYHKEYDVKRHKDYYNKANQTSAGFDWAGHKHSQETRRLLSAQRLGNKHSLGIKQSTEHVRCRTLANTDNPKMSTSNKPEWQRTCPHCNLTTNIQNIARWHGDNCKLKGE